jgi:hypothetical protein
VLDLTNQTQPYRQLSLSEATLLAAGAAAAGRSLAAGPTMHHPSGAASLEQQQHQQGGVGQRRRGRGRGGQAAGGGGSPHDVNGGMDLAASSRLLRTSSGKVLRWDHAVVSAALCWYACMTQCSMYARKGVAGAHAHLMMPVVVLKAPLHFMAATGWHLPHQPCWHAVCVASV